MMSKKTQTLTRNPAPANPVILTVPRNPARSPRIVLNLLSLSPVTRDERERDLRGDRRGRRGGEKGRKRYDKVLSREVAGLFITSTTAQWQLPAEKK